MATTGDSAPAGRVLVGSVLRALRLLDLFERGRPEMTLSEFVSRGGYSKSTTYRLLMTLAEAGWLERGPGGTFRLSIRPFQVGSILVDSLELRREAGPVMARVAATVNETVFLVVAAGALAVCLERIDSEQGVRLSELYVGGSQPLHLGAAPRALLAYDEDALLPPLLAAGLSRRTERSIVDEAELRADLALTRQRGYSVSDEDVTRDVAAIGAPVFGAHGGAVGAISIGGLRQRLMPPRADHISCLHQACQELSTRLGHRNA